MAEFMFVNLNNPTQNKRREVRKLVRSHVSYMQHSQKRTDLGQIRKPSKSRYTDRSVNGWAVLDDNSRAARSSQLKVNAASDLDSGLLPQHESTLPGSVQARSPRQMYDKKLTSAGKTRGRPRQIQRQPKASPTPQPIPIVDEGVNTKPESPQAVSTLPNVKSETAAASPEDFSMKQEMVHETDHKWDIVSPHSSQSQSLSPSSTISKWGGWEGDRPSSKSLPPLYYFSFGDPTDELRNRIELSGIGLSSALAFLANITDLLGPGCDNAYSLPTGSLRKHLKDGLAADRAARAGILICSVGAISSHRREPLRFHSLLSLRGYAISCIQAALSDPSTCHSDHTALAIASLGNFELIIGCDKASQTHLQGLASIKNARGESLNWVLDGVLSWMAALRRPQISEGTIAILDGSNTAA